MIAACAEHVRIAVGTFCTLLLVRTGLAAATAATAVAAAAAVAAIMLALWSLVFAATSMAILALLGFLQKKTKHRF